MSVEALAGAGRHADEITQRPSDEIVARVRPAGVTIVESRLTRLSYAPEIAQAMLQMALQRLQEEDVVELDEERKASMVSNLLVVLCSDRDAQPVVNAGTLYQ